jgi:hypothetical protein
VHRHGAYLGQVRPEHVKSPAPDELPILFGHPELLNALIQRDQVLLQQNAAGVEVDEPLDRRHIGRGRAAHHKPVRP